MLWQLCSGIDENAVGASAQLVFAPIDESFADDAPLLPSGFRVIPLDPKTVTVTYQPSAVRFLLACLYYVGSFFSELEKIHFYSRLCKLIIINCIGLKGSHSDELAHLLF